MDMCYKKRFGTSGISGQLYETKLISLIVFRLLHNNNVEDFYLASNMDEIGSFDDICLKVKFTNHTRPIVLFIQAKHRDNDDKFLTLDNKTDAVKWSDSILKIKKKIASSKSQDKLFDGNVDETDYVFILYTNANCDFDSHIVLDSIYASELNNLIATSATVGSRPLYSEKDVEDLGKKISNEDVAVLAERFAKFLGDKTYQITNIMNDEYILRYHVLLSHYVLNVSKIQHDEHNINLKWRMMTFKKQFFTTSDEYLKLFKNHLYDHILKNQVKFRRQSSQIEKKMPPSSPTSEPWNEELIALFFAKPSADTLSPLIENYLTCNKLGKLEFISVRPAGDVKQLKQININRSVLNEAREIAAKSKLQFLKLKVPIGFGNIDLAVNGGAKKIERRLQHLTDVMVDLCNQFKEVDTQYRIVTIDDNIDTTLLCSRGGLATAVGNILNYDENTKLLKFADDNNYLEDNAKSLHSNLKQKLNNFHDYRFEVKTLKLPKLSFDCTNISKGFLNKLIIYTKQSNQCEVEEILKGEIQEFLDTKPRQNSVTADNVYLCYHNLIQNWWMSPKTGPYLTKASDIFERATNNTVTEQQLTALHNVFYMSNIKYFTNNFEENSLKLLTCINNFSKVVLSTDITTLTTVKVVQVLNNMCNYKHAVLDVTSALDMPTAEFCSLEMELRTTDKIIIIVFDNIQHIGQLHVVNEIVQALEEKQVIAITNKDYTKMVKQYLKCANVICDKEQNLTQLVPESRKYILNNAKIVFQGLEMNLDELVDDTSVGFLKGSVLKKLLNNETINLGSSLSSRNYEEIQHLYMDRRVSQASDDNYHETNYGNIGFVKTFNDLQDDTVLITAAPGMGKSTLLTHLSIETKRLDNKVWIVRINLLDYSKEFYKWQERNITINTLAMLKFICNVVLRENNTSIELRECGDRIYLDEDLSNESTTFELNMFLHCYNENKVIFLFDGFDEICPHYKDNVIMFFEVVRNFPRTNKVWVTSRPYSDILPDLQKALGKSYKLEHMSDLEQAIYLTNIWRSKLTLDKLNDVQLQNVMNYKKFINVVMATSYAPDALNFRFRRIFFIFFDYLYSHCPHVNPNIEWLCNRDRFKVSYTLPELSTLEAVYFANKQNTSTTTGDVDTLLGTPLLLYFIAEYFVDIIAVSKNVETWQLAVNILSIYEMFIESKLRKVLFQDKNKMDVYNPDIMMKFERERAVCVSMHKKIAAYVLLGSPIFSALNFEELKDMNPLEGGGLPEFEVIIHTIKTGADKTGLISHVTADDVPVFIHRTFTEYFAAEFICDILKSNKYEYYKRKLLYTTAFICHMNDVFPWINKKREIDKGLETIIRKIENQNPLFLTSYRTILENANLPLEQFVRLMNSSSEDYEEDYFNKYSQLNAQIYLYSQAFARDGNLKDFPKNIIAKMKPHLKKYFIAQIPPTKQKNWLRRAFSYSK